MEQSNVGHELAISSFQQLMPNRSKAETVVLSNPLLLLNQRRWEMAILQIFSGVKLYAEMHRLRYLEVVGDDGVMGDAVEDIMAGLKTLLNGEIGHLDGATMSTMFREFAAANNINYPT